jgi:predicted RNase H-like HicB family nuclease
MRWNDRETWQDAATRAAQRAVAAGLTVEAVLSEAGRRARSYARRVRGIPVAERNRREQDYRFWYLDMALTDTYWAACDREDDQQAYWRTLPYNGWKRGTRSYRRTCMNDIPKYSLHLLWSEEDKQFVVIFPEWEGAWTMPFTGAPTYEEAARKAQAAIVTMVEYSRDKGESLPEVQYYQSGED